MDRTLYAYVRGSEKGLPVLLIFCHIVRVYLDHGHIETLALCTSLEMIVPSCYRFGVNLSARYSKELIGALGSLTVNTVDNSSELATLYALK